MPHQIQISKDSQFFIAICQYDIHSYVSLGVKSGDQDPFFLASFGKIAYSESDCEVDLKACSESVIWQTDAVIQNESIIAHENYDGSLRTPGRAEVQYKAYGITYQHYIQFLEYMAELSKKQQIRYLHAPILQAYTVVEEDEHKATLEWKDLASKKDSLIRLDPADNCLDAFTNTCRHSAIRLTERAKQASGLGLGISSFFFREPPLTALFSGGYAKDTHYFYILPLPPTAFAEIEGEKKRILNKLYKRLDKMVLIAQDNPLSIEKFEALKNLYQDLATKSPATILDVIASIEDWESKHQRVIKSHRRNHWFHFATATENMFEKLHERFARIKEAQDTPPDYNSPNGIR